MYLITGGEGFIGRNICKKTGGVSFDIKSGLDILNTPQLEQTVKNSQIKAIFHCAAKISVPESVEKPEEYYRTNVEGTKNIIEVAKKCSAKIVFSSSAAVYGESSVRMNETSPLTPKSPYAENKRDGEELLKAASESATTGSQHVALRYFNAYGPGQSAQYAGVITFFIMNALKGADLVIYGDGKQVRDFVFVDDIVRSNVMAMEYENKNGQFEIFNIGSGTETSVQQLAEMIIELTNSSSKIVYMPARQGDIVYSQADVSKAKDVLGWEAKVALKEGLRKTVEFYRNPR